MRVLVSTALSQFTGYGRDGIGLLKALVRRGADVCVIPTTVDSGLPPEVAFLLTKEVKAPFDLFINHTDPMAMELRDDVRMASDIAVAWTMWEWLDIKGAMAKKHEKTLRNRLKDFDVFAGYSAVDMDAFDPYLPEKTPRFVQMGGYEPDLWPVLDRDWNEKFRFIMHGQLSPRKGPFHAIRAFSELRAEHPDFAEGATLALHTNAPGLVQQMEDVYPGLRVFYESWPLDVLKQFYQSAHVLLAPSRGEGKNLPCLEFMTTGGTVIATDWSGMHNWLNPSYSYPLNYAIEPMDPYSNPALCAQPDVDHLKELMLHCFRNRDEVREKGMLASRIIPAAWNWDRVVDDLLQKIREAVPEKGERLWMKAQIAQTEVSRGH